MKLNSFRQGFVGVMLVAVLFSTVAPSVCRCEHCPCGNSTKRSIKTDSSVADKKCCCKSQEVVSDKTDKKCCGKTPCRCCVIQKDYATVPKGVSTFEKPNVEQIWNVVSVLPIGSADALRLFYFDCRHVSLLSYVPLRILLCVFRN